MHPGCCEEERPGLAGAFTLLESCHAKPNVNSSIKQYIFMIRNEFYNHDVMVKKISIIPIR